MSSKKFVKKVRVELKVIHFHSLDDFRLERIQEPVSCPLNNNSIAEFQNKVKWLWESLPNLNIRGPGKLLT